VIDLLRFIGLVNAAVWFGSAVYHVLGIDPAVAPAQLDAVLGSRNAPYFSGLIEHAFLERYFWLHLFCGSIAILHAFAEWLYLGRTPRRWWVGLIGALFALNLLSGLALSPHLATLHATRYAVNYPAERRMAARGRSGSGMELRKCCVCCAGWHGGLLLAHGKPGILHAFQQRRQIPKLTGSLCSANLSCQKGQPLRQPPPGI